MEGRLSGWRDPESEQERAEVWEKGTELRQKQIMDSLVFTYESGLEPRAYAC